MRKFVEVCPCIEETDIQKMGMKGPTDLSSVKGAT